MFGCQPDQLYFPQLWDVAQGLQHVSHGSGYQMQPGGQRLQGGATCSKTPLIKSLHRWSNACCAHCSEISTSKDGNASSQCIVCVAVVTNIACSTSHLARCHTYAGCLWKTWPLHSKYQPPVVWSWLRGGNSQVLLGGSHARLHLHIDNSCPVHT